MVILEPRGVTTDAPDRASTLAGFAVATVTGAAKNTITITIVEILIGINVPHSIVRELI